MSKKAGVPFSVGIQVDSSLTGLSATLAAKYKLDGSADEFTVVEGTFSEETPGFYSIPMTIAAKGVYLVNISSSDAAISPVSNYAVVNGVNIDDINDAIAVAQGDITAIKSQVDALDESVVNGISDKVTALDAKLTDLGVLLTDENDPAVTSLKELLLQITEAGSDRDGVLSTLTNFTDDIEIMLRGDEFLSDGVTANPFYGKTTADVYDSLQEATSYIHGAVSDIKTQIIADAQATRDLLVQKIADVKTLVEANQSELGNVDYGLSALKAALVTITENTSTSTEDLLEAINESETTVITTLHSDRDVILGALNDGTNGLAAIKSAVMTKLDTIESKVDLISKRQSTMVL
jgi:hypothetical protein